GLNHVSYAQALQRGGARITILSRVTSVRRQDNKLAAVIGSDYGSRTEERLVDQVVVEHDTLPLDELYFALKPESRNGSEVDYQTLIESRPQDLTRNPD